MHLAPAWVHAHIESQRCRSQKTASLPITDNASTLRLVITSSLCPIISTPVQGGGGETIRFERAFSVLLASDGAAPDGLAALAAAGGAAQPSPIAVIADAIQTRILRTFSNASPRPPETVFRNWFALKCLQDGGAPQAESACIGTGRCG